MTELTLEIVEGPDAGRQMTLGHPVVIGRAPDVDFVLADGQVSRRHARVTPDEDGGVVVEDLGSANGTFVNHNELLGPTRLDPTDELLVGVTLLELRSGAQIATQTSVVRAIPPALARAPRTPDYVNPDVIRAEQGVIAESAGARELEKFRDVRVRHRAQLAPLALLMLIALVLFVYFATR